MPVGNHMFSKSIDGKLATHTPIPNMYSKLKMAKVVFWFCVALSCCSQVTLSNVFDNLLNDVDPCKEVCDKTFSVHTYPEPDHLECCKRGCRFYTLIDLSGKQNGDINATRNMCSASCVEAYDRSADLYACNVGCNNQIPSAVHDDSDDEDPEADTLTLHMLKPLMYIHNIYTTVVDHVVRIMSITWALYVQPDNGDVVIVQSEPKVITGYVGGTDFEDKEQGDSSDLVNGVAKSRTSDLSDGDGQDSGSLPDIYSYHQRTIEKVASSANQLPVRITLNTFTSEEVQSIDWLGCVSRKSGLPRWLLGLIIFASALVMVWLCFATTATAPDQRIKSQPLSINGDMDSWESLPEKVKLQESCEIALLHGEAGALPLKYKLVTV